MNFAPSRRGPLSAKNSDVAGKIRRRLSRRSWPMASSPWNCSHRPPTTSQMFLILYSILSFFFSFDPNRITDAAGDAQEDDGQANINRDLHAKIFHEHLETDEDEHKCDALLQVSELIHRPAEQEEQRTQTQDSKDI